jgi:hypothetical protein
MKTRLRTLLTALLLSVLLEPAAANGSSLLAQSFLERQMINPSGTIATHLLDAPSVDPNIAAGRETLSESLGLYLTYAVERRDRDLFDRYYARLTASYMTRDGFVYWKLAGDGTRTVSTNALIDDWRIGVALFRAGELWGNAQYLASAKSIMTSLNTRNMKNGYYVDFYDQTYHLSSNTLTTLYVDPVALQYMSKYGLITASANRTMRSFLKNIPNDGVFFAKTYNVVAKTYQYDANVNLLEQVYAAYHRAQDGVATPAFYAFLKNEFQSRGILPGMYDRLSRKPSVPYESNALYGLTILYALENRDAAFAKALYARMLQYQVTDAASPYYGGFVVQTPSGMDTHVFDNLFPMLAMQRIETL